MFFKLLKLFKTLSLFTASYSNNVFLEPLSKEDEEMYIDKFLNGDMDARNKLIEHNLRLVAHIVKKIDTNNKEQDDLISIGTIGLIKGVDTFKKNKGNRITTYCAKCIQNEILMYFRSNNKNTKNISLNDSIGYDKDGNEIAIMDVLSADTKDMDEEIDKKDNIKLLNKYLDVLNDRESEIIKRRYGFDNYEIQTQKKIAEELKISRSYVSRIEKRALTHILRKFIKHEKEVTKK